MKKKTEEIDDDFIYEEEQSLRQWYVWFVLLLAFFLSVAFSITSLLNYMDGTAGAASYIVLSALFMFISLFFIISTAGSKLKVKASEDALYFQWSPLNNKYNKVYWQNIKSISLIEYNSFGYGMRISEKYGSIYNAFGGYGINLETRGGNKFLVGTAQPKEIEKILVGKHDEYFFKYENNIEKKK